MVWSSSTTRHVGWLRSVLTLWPDELNTSIPLLPDPLVLPLDGTPPWFICSFSDAIRSIGRSSTRSCQQTARCLATAVLGHQLLLFPSAGDALPGIACRHVGQ